MNLIAAGALVSVLTAQSVRPQPFDMVVALYRSGQYAQAVSEVVTRTDEAFNDAAEQWLDVGRRGRTRPHLEAALMVYTEATFGAFDESLRRELTLTQTKTASRLPLYLRRVKRLQHMLAEEDRRSPFLRMWYLLWGAYLQSRNPRYVDPAVDFLDVAGEVFFDDPEVLLMLGTAKELEWWGAPDNPQRHPDRDADKGARPLREARDHFRKALATELGSLAEVHLRLGRTLTALEDYDEVASHLEPFQALPGNPLLAYLANLFMGELHERRGNVSAAAAAYDAALRLMPTAQSARLAASHLEFISGTRTRAAEIVTQTLSSSKLDIDPWWWYIRGQAWQYEPRLGAARKAVQQ